jgi:Matrixin
VNQCNLDGRTGDPTRLEFDGNTNLHANIASSTGDCVNSDGDNITEFGNPPVGLKAKACIWGVVTSGPDTITSSDVRFNKSDYRWAAYVGDACTSAYDINAIATHEFGHTMGLDDLNSDADRNLTMYYETLPCETKGRTLGRGDMCGLYYLYNPAKLPGCLQ